MDANDVADAEDEWEVDADSLRGDESCLLTEDVLVSLRNDFRKQGKCPSAFFSGPAPVDRSNHLPRPCDDTLAFRSS